MKKSIASILLFCIFLLHGCKKYPDGPLISFRSAKKIIKGSWYYEHYYEDEKDLVYLLKCDTCFKSSIDFTYDSDGDFWFFTLQNYSGGVEGRWVIIENDKCIGFNQVRSSYNIGPPFNTSTTRQIWRIRRLTKNEFWLTCDFEGKHYELNLYK